MFLRCKVRRKDGKQHRYWSVVENTRTARGRVVQRHVLYLGEINDTQELAWRRSIEVLEEKAPRNRARCRCFRKTFVGLPFARQARADAEPGDPHLSVGAVHAT